ncbi:MAG: CRISPR-associated endonuclease Cas2 [Candidatus Pacearchaeota archaeon]
MYSIIVYDASKKRANKICNFLKRYLNWIQNSVFEGEISEGKLKRLIRGLKKIVKEEDSIIIFKFRDKELMKKEVIGKEKAEITNII